MSKLSAALTPKRFAACRHDRREEIAASNGVRRSRKKLHHVGRPTITGATDAFSQRLLSCASDLFTGPAMKVDFVSISLIGRALRQMTALCANATPLACPVSTYEADIENVRPGPMPMA